MIVVCTLVLYDVVHAVVVVPLLASEVDLLVSQDVVVEVLIATLVVELTDQAVLVA